MKSKSKMKIVRKQVTCIKCGLMKIVNAANFFKSYSPLHIAGVANICKSCIYDIYDGAIKDGMTTQKAMVEVCKILDKPFVYSLYKLAIESNKDNKGTIGHYFKLVHLPQYLKQGIKTFNDSNLIEGNFKEVEEKRIVNGEVDTDSEDLSDFWGEGYKPELYKLFNKKYKELSKGYDQKTTLHKEALKTYIRFRVREELATASGDSFEAKKWGELAQKASQDAKINVSQLNKSDLSGGIDLISQLFAAVETEVGIIPILPKLMEQPYDDVDMIIWCIINYFRRIEDKPPVEYKEIWKFYDDMINAYCEQNRMSPRETEIYKRKRNNVFKDLEKIFIEPSYSEEE